MVNPVPEKDVPQKKDIDLTLQITLASSISYVNYQAERNEKAFRGSNKQNSFSFLKKIDILNNGAKDVYDATLEINFLPTNIVCTPLKIACLEKGKTTTIEEGYDIAVDPSYLYSLSEAVPGSVCFLLKAKDGTLLAKTLKDITLLPIGESAAKDRKPVILASFATPNDEAVLSLVREASKIKAKKYGSGDFDGYQQEDPQDVLEQIDSLWMALEEVGIAYSNPPASFEKTFQRVRLPFEVLLEKTGTCIDLSLLFCSCLESVGLHPLVIVVDGHAFAGCWIVDETYPMSYIENSTLLSNDSAPGFDKLKLYNAVGFTNPANLSPLQAGESAQHDLANTPFLYALDIVRCREEKILPLPTPKTTDGKKEVDFAGAFYSPRAEKEIYQPKEKGVIEGPTTPKGKFAIWEEKLLDLDMRNNLINTRLTRSGVQILSDDVTALFNSFSTTPQFGLFPLSSKPENGKKVIAFETVKSQMSDTLQSLSMRNLLATASLNGKPEENIIALARKSNSEVEESGSNPLYLAVGAIQWFDNEKAAKAQSTSYFSPILLIPAVLPRHRNGPYFQIHLDMDGIQFNTTAFEYFRRNLDLDFSEFNHLFDDKSKPIDLQKIYNTIRHKIASKLNWSVMDDFLALSLFSFAHFVMWTDMKDYQEQFLKNPVVKSFVTGQKEWEDNPLEIAPKEIDDKISPEDLAIPLSADSSQIKAVISSLQGESFILDGPPGTGKSQTIANMITNFLYHGKKVLFVAEKEVALEVVKDRLDHLGLGDFCLQVHSAKANKKDVLSSIKAAWATGSVLTPEEYAAKAKELESQRKALNLTLEKLHEKRHYLMSIYEAILLYLSLPEYAGKATIEKDYASRLTEQQYQQALAALSAIKDGSPLVGGYHENPLLLFTSREYSLEKRDALFAALPSFKEELGRFTDIVSSFFKDKNLSIPLTKGNIFTLGEILSSLKEKPAVAYRFLDHDEYLQEQNALLDYLNRVYLYKQEKEALSLLFKEGVLSLEEESLSQSLQEASSSNLFKRLFLENQVFHALRAYEEHPHALEKKNCALYLQKIHAVKELAKKSVNDNPFLEIVFPSEKEKTSLSIAKDIEKTKNTLRIATLLSSFTPYKDGNLAWLKNYFVAMEARPDALYENSVTSYLASLSSFKASSERLKNAYAFDFLSYPDEDDYFAKNALLLEKAIPQKEKLADWVNFLKKLDQAAGLLPASFLESYKNGALLEKDLIPSYQCALAYRILSSGLDEEGISSLSSHDVDSLVNSYKRNIDLFAALSVEVTASRITSFYPGSASHFASSSLPYQLSKLTENGGRGMSLRGIFDHYGELIETLCPCFLMSPLSVAQYLSPEKDPFDVVIFDEASQIPTSEAIGAIARGKSVIIAGDKNQMPPSNYFQSSVIDEDDDDFLEDDLESLLDDAIALKLPHIPLLCHYRSNHESLIAFSNNKFYQNSLVTFPSPKEQESRVSLVYLPDGAYEQGRGVNLPEAKAIVKEVLRRLHDPLLSQKSIGIITFNEKQMNLVDDLLDKEFDKDIALERNPGGESIFVKNLENVQGDERDVILFSICFGPCGKDKKMPLNFGPLSREKGERRLNVAVSRSREEMIVYSSAKPEDIRDQEAKNEGAGYLKAFLSYAEYGTKALTNSSSTTPYVPEVSIAEYLQKDLKEQGYDSDIHLGTSSFRVDLAVKDPKNPESYILGVLVDASPYVGSATCRDRNVVEPGMLERLHWNFIRVFSVEYLDHKNEVLARIVKAIENPCPETPKEDAPLFPVVFKKKEKPDALYPHQRPYPSTSYLPESPNQDLLPVIKEILERESPLSLSLLEKRIRTIFSYPRITSALESQIKKALSSLGAKGERYLDEIYLWNGTSLPLAYDLFRVGGDREIDDLPYQEVTNAAEDILGAQGAMVEEDLYKQLDRLFGGLSLTDKAKNHFEKCLKAAANYSFGSITNKNGMFSLQQPA